VRASPLTVIVTIAVASVQYGCATARMFRADHQYFPGLRPSIRRRSVRLLASGLRPGFRGGLSAHAHGLGAASTFLGSLAAGVGALAVAVPDLPFSAVADTVLLPMGLVGYHAESNTYVFPACAVHWVEP
jgi:uncharacterized protein YceK